MAIQRLRLRVAPGDEGHRLDVVAQRWLEEALARPLSKATVRRLIMAGVLRVDGRPSRRPGMLVAPGLRIEALLDAARLPPAARPGVVVPPAGLVVLYEDEWLIAVAKPAGVQVHASADSERVDLYTLVRQQLAARSGTRETGIEGLPGLPYLGLHHRLDRDTSGVVVFTKQPTVNKALAGQFENRSVEKSYHAVTGTRDGVPRGEWRVEGRLALQGPGRRARVASTASGGREAVTVFRVLDRLRGGLLVEARPETGRKHQIRAHLAESGLPILGDVRYGGAATVGGVTIRRTMLHARRIVLAHPLTGLQVSIECGYPEDFGEVLARLRG